MLEGIKGIRVFADGKPIAEITLKPAFQVTILERIAYLFFNENSTVETVEEFLCKRAFPNRHDESTKDALKNLGLYFYDPIAIIRKTHGFMLHDDITVELDMLPDGEQDERVG